MSDEELWRLFELMKKTDKYFYKDVVLATGQIYLSKLKDPAINCQPPEKE